MQRLGEDSHANRLEIFHHYSVNYGVSLKILSVRGILQPLSVGSPVTFGQSDGGLVGVDRVEDALISDLGLRDEADLGAEIGDAGGHDDGVLAVIRGREIKGRPKRGAHSQGGLVTSVTDEGDCRGFVRRCRRSQ